MKCWQTQKNPTETMPANAGDKIHEAPVKYIYLVINKIHNVKFDYMFR